MTGQNQSTSFTHDDTRHIKSYTPDRRVDHSLDKLGAGILTNETLNQAALRGSRKNDSPEGNQKRNQEPNIFFNSLTERNEQASATPVDNFDSTDPKSEEKLQRLIFRKRFRLKA